MTWSPEAEFYLKNLSDVEAILELRTLARKKIIDDLQERLAGRIKADTSKQAWRGMSSLKVEFDGKELWWWDPRLFNYNSNEGFYFGLFTLEDKRVIDATNEETGVFLQLSYLEANERTRLSKRQLSKVTGGQFAPSPNRIRIDPTLYDEYFVAVQPIFKICNPSLLLDLDRAVTAIVKEAQAFTEAFAPLLRKPGGARR